jgi:hypothetical protein
MSYPVFASGEVLSHVDMNAVGMWEAIPTGIVGTGASISKNTITLSSCTSVTANNVFTTNFNDYLILIRVSQGSGDVFMRLASGGTAVSSSTYNYAVMQAYAGAGASASRAANQTSMVIMSNNNGVFGSASIDVFAPFLAAPTMFQSNNLRNDGNYQTPANYLLYGNNTNSTSYDGVNIFCAGGMTGTISFYGRNK